MKTKRVETGWFYAAPAVLNSLSNCFNNYGPLQFPEKLIPLMITNILAGKPIPVYGDGRPIRDWLYVDDHNQGVDLILAHPQLLL